jgi:hypothetical protein
MGPFCSLLYALNITFVLIKYSAKAGINKPIFVNIRKAGWVMKLPDGLLCRAPYMLPYVRPHYQASVFVSEEINFSRRVWKLNRQFFLLVGVKLHISDMSPAFRRLCEVQSFPSSTTMEALCDWHLDHLSASSRQTVVES